MIIWSLCFVPPQLAVQVSLALDQCETQYGTGVSAGFWSSQTFGGRGFGCLLAVLPSPSIAGVWPDPVLFQAGRRSHVRTAAPFCTHVRAAQGKSSDMQLVMEMTSPHRALPLATVGSPCSNNQQQHPGWTWPVHSQDSLTATRQSCSACFFSIRWVSLVDLI